MFKKNYHSFNAALLNLFCIQNFDTAGKGKKIKKKLVYTTINYLLLQLQIYFIPRKNE